LAMLVILKLSKYYKINQEVIFDLIFYLMLAGIIGARIYDVLLEFSYYAEHPINIFKIWQGGLAIHGGIIAGIITLWIFSKKQKLNFWKITALAVSVMPLAQAMGRWGNYFNNELFGLPTSAPWGIPVLPENKIMEFYDYSFFHPTFLYESIGNLIIFIFLIVLNIWMIRSKKMKNIYYQIILSTYLILYSLLRFSLEFIRIDITPSFIGFRIPQIASMIIILVVVIFWIVKYYKILKQRHINAKNI